MVTLPLPGLADGTIYEPRPNGDWVLHRTRGESTRCGRALHDGYRDHAPDRGGRPPNVWRCVCLEAQR